MEICKGVSASPGLVLGQVSRLERHVETFSTGPFDPERELRQLEDAVRTAQSELDSMAERAASTEQAILQFQSMMLDDEGMMNEVRFCIKAGISAAAAMDKVGQRYADQLANMKDNPYMQLRSVDILDATSRVINILGNRPRMWLALDHPVILAADRLMPTDLFSVPSGMILGVITTEGSGQSHAAIIARAMNIPGIVQVGADFLEDCDGRTVILDASVSCSAKTKKCGCWAASPATPGTAQPLSCWPTALARRTSTPPCSPVPGAWACCAAAT